MNKKSKSTFGIIALFLILIVSGIFTFNLFDKKEYKIEINNSIKDYSMEVCNKDCNDVYLGICFDNSSKYYMCNLIDEQCNVNDFELVNKIKYFENNNIKIYGLSTCPHCQNQLSDFGKYSSVVLEKGLFVFCDKVNDSACNDITSVPAWKQNGEIVNVGYINLSSLDF
jgi:hypothetical protein